MLTDGEPTEPEIERTTPRQYLVKCETCSFERRAEGRDEAAAIADDHRRETRHDVVALEVPPSIGSA